MSTSETAAEYQPPGDKEISEDPAESEVTVVVEEKMDDTGLRMEKGEKWVECK